jgi:hypothetical protein
MGHREECKVKLVFKFISVPIRTFYGNCVPLLLLKLMQVVARVFIIVP